MPRPRIDRGAIFRMMALNWNKRKIKKETGIGEATYWRIKAEFEKFSETEKQTIRDLASQEEKVKAKFIEYEFVQRWVQRIKSGRKPVKSWRTRFNSCRRVWMILQKKNPENWTIDDIELRAIPELRKRCSKSINHYLVALRSLRPDFKFPDEKGETLPTERKPEPTYEWKIIYEKIMQKGLKSYFAVGGFQAELIKRLHVTLGCREGTTGIGGILGLEWNRVHWNKRTIDVYEGKTGGGFYWLDCPLDLFGDRTFEMLRQYWVQQGKPTSGKIFGDVGYHATKFRKAKVYLTDIYKETAEAIGEVYGRKGITPHFARKLHACLLIDADVPLEMVAGDKPFGIMGVGWEDLSTLKKYYLAFRKTKVEENRQKAKQLNI